MRLYLCNKNVPGFTYLTCVFSTIQWTFLFETTAKWSEESAQRPVAAGGKNWGGGCTQFHKQFFTINQTVRLIWTQLLTFSFSAKLLLSNGYWSRDCTEFGSCLGINNTWVRHCHVIENCSTTDHETSLDFSSLGRQKNRPFQLNLRTLIG